MASRRLYSWIWSEEASSGQSALELARRSMQGDLGSAYHFSNWDVIEHDGHVIAGLNSFLLPPVAKVADMPAHIATVVQPMIQLKAIAEGSWYIAVASVFPEGRGSGAGTAILEFAERKAKRAGVAQLTLLVGSFNKGARRLYERNGFVEWGRRRFVPFPGSDPEGDWIWKVKRLSR